MIIDKNWLFRVYQSPEDGDGASAGGASTTGVQTNSGDTGGNNTVLTGDNSDASTGDTGGADDTGGSDDADTGAADDSGDTDVGGEQTGEGSQTTPDTYADFALPDGVTVDESLLAKATPIFRELGLTQEQAQKLVDLQAEQVQASSQSQVDAFNQLMTDWREKSINDKEFGGDKFEENIKVAKSAIDKFGTPELKQLLEEHGVGNHPEVIRFMVKVGKLTAEDVPGAGDNPTSKEQDRVSLLYPNDKTA